MHISRHLGEENPKHFRTGEDDLIELTETK
jgi:hypothetical protein